MNAAVKACELVEDGMAVGLGTGSTTAYAIRELGRRVDEGLDIVGVPTSYASEALAIECGIPLSTLAECPELDVDIDGADQADSSLNVIKGGARPTLGKRSSPAPLRSLPWSSTATS